MSEPNPWPAVSTGDEPFQIEAEQEAPKCPVDDPEFLLWHFAINSRHGQLVVGRERWLQYARTLRKLLEQRALPPAPG